MLLRKKERFHRQFRRIGYISDFQNFKEHSKKLKTEICKAYYQYVLVTENAVLNNDISGVFKMFKRKKEDNIGLGIKFSDGRLLNGASTADSFAQYFKSVYSA